MTQTAVPSTRPYVGRHREPETPEVPATVNTRPRDLRELEGATRDLSSLAGLLASARAVWRFRP